MSNKKTKKTKKIAVITGATSGIGKEVALLFANKGYYVYALSRSAKDTRIELCGLGAIEYRSCDVCDEDSINEAFSGILRIDVLVHAAGFGIAGSAEMTSSRDAKSQFETNFFGVLNVNRAAIKIMRAQKNGIIIITGSVAGVFAIPFQSHYSATKAALESYASALRLELRKFKIKVSLIQPGDTKTSFTKKRNYIEPADSPYLDTSTKAVSKMAYDEENGLEASKVARLYYKICQKKNPAPVYTTGFNSK